MVELLTTTQDRLDTIGIRPAESLGQHFLIDQGALDTIVDQVRPGSTIIEVGVGLGTLTEAIAPKAGSLIGIEIDKRFADTLLELRTQFPNTKFLLQDALTVNLKKHIEPDNTQIFANLPFHITEPFLTRLIDLPILNAVLILGEKAAEELTASAESAAYGRMSLLAQTFFTVTREATIPKQGFYPVPRTDAAIVTLTPKHLSDITANKASAIFAQIFRDSPKHSPVINSIKDAIMTLNNVDTSKLEKKQHYHQRNRAAMRRQLRELVDNYNTTGEYATEDTGRRKSVFSQEQAFAIISEMGIPEDLLKKPFTALYNSQLRELARAITSYYAQ